MDLPVWALNKRRKCGVDKPTAFAISQSVSLRSRLRFMRAITACTRWSTDSAPINWLHLCELYFFAGEFRRPLRLIDCPARRVWPAGVGGSSSRSSGFDCAHQKSNSAVRLLASCGCRIINARVLASGMISGTMTIRWSKIINLWGSTPSKTRASSPPSIHAFKYGLT